MNMNQTNEFNLEAYDYYLPEEKIAQVAVEPRDSSRLMVLSRAGNFISDDYTRNLTKHIDANTVIVLNDVRVIPGRFHVQKSTGGKVEVLILSVMGDNTAKILLNSKRPISEGTSLFYDKNGIAFEIEIQSTPMSGGVRLSKFKGFNLTPENISKIGLPPLPPYIKRKEHDERFENDKHRYQTVFAQKGEAAAAPTAGLHFTEAGLNELKKNFEVHTITLNVGLGTFQPVRSDNIKTHKMHSEYYHIDPATADALQKAKANGKRILAVGTTVVRTLESVANKNFTSDSLQGETDIFIYPGYKYRFVDSIMTNFHLPKSTLIMMIAAFMGRENILNAYEMAIEKGYRFYSYGDAMLIV